MLLSNTPLARRHLFLHPRIHLFIIRLTYSKTFSRTNEEKDALRVLPYSVSWLLLAYIMVVRPFIEFLTLELTREPLKQPELL